MTDYPSFNSLDDANIYVNLDEPCDTVEFCPYFPFTSCFASGTYSYTPSTKIKDGHFTCYYVDQKSQPFKLRQFHKQPVDAILDLKWAPFLPKHCFTQAFEENATSSIVAGACANTGIQFFKFTADPSNSTSMPNVKQISKKIENPFGIEPKRMCLSLDWHRYSIPEDSKLVTSLDNQLVSVVRTSFPSLYSESQTECSEAIVDYVWDAHSSDVWTAAWAHPQEYPEVVLSGADDHRLRAWDLRLIDKCNQKQQKCNEEKEQQGKTTNEDDSLEDDVEEEEDDFDSSFQLFKTPQRPLSPFHQQTKYQRPKPIVENSTSHETGVTCISQHPFHPHNFATGSFDEHVRLWDLRKLDEPVWTMKAKDGVWRIKWIAQEMRENYSSDKEKGCFECEDPKKYRFGDEGDLMLIACTHGGCSCIYSFDGTSQPDESSSSAEVPPQPSSSASPSSKQTPSEVKSVIQSPRLVFTHSGHKSMNYGCDWMRPLPDSNSLFCASVGFYDKSLHVWRADKRDGEGSEDKKEDKKETENPKSE
ncbi:diphthine methyl ester acylhydrolase [Monocercomonoides exilis]|uniref:diphthine methyl ester acylhydrolase n=1 Tax=Monocercomonoides exilis TaxID=2049356 RepID=UPI003559DDD5|nr:diphthine methyl ester acylhydrolase [Monocercomonoides exilis]|eukprot:MONOS_10410.1-p1 / transcript=MONOS_10410.1 / gene=MONOS_10410 / organism=Monocercomonoides_exilis_PA203 / gene_product=unspecified product / transcript_product=unspecified product / location=Mono_scaffold00473:20754-22349(+) / protein_length=531 / sequence_SO=supercontig / SO=protein_coding / is_pseudo=false